MRDDKERHIELILQNWLIFDISRTPDDYLVTTQYALPPKFCPGCGLINPRLIKYGTKEQMLRDLPIRWLRVSTIRQRYMCKECGVAFWESLTYEIEQS